MAKWLEPIVQAMANLGGSAHYSDLYAEIERISTGPFSDNWKAAIRQTIEFHSSDSIVFKGIDIFYSVEGKGKGKWGLRGFLMATPDAIDKELASSQDSIPERRLTKTYRILRDTTLARTVKLLYDHSCQLCGSKIKLAEGKAYSEAHRIRPLGMPHNGPDAISNILVLCPNHHVMLDYGAIPIETNKLILSPEHTLNKFHVDYHNNQIYGRG
jgi:hypothetical protein